MNKDEIAEVREKLDTLIASTQELEESLKNLSMREFSEAFELISKGLKCDFEFGYELIRLVENKSEIEARNVLRSFMDLYQLSETWGN